MDTLSQVIQIIYYISLAVAAISAVLFVVGATLMFGANGFGYYGGTIFFSTLLATVAVSPILGAFEYLNPSAPKFPTANFAPIYEVVFGLNLLLSLSLVLLMFRQVLKFFPVFILPALLTSAWAAKTIDIVGFVWSTGNTLNIWVYSLLGIGYLLAYLFIPIYAFYLVVGDWVGENPSATKKPSRAPKPASPARQIKEENRPAQSADSKPKAQNTSRLEPTPGEPVARPASPEPPPTGLSPELGQLLADLRGENYRAKLAALRSISEHQIYAEPILACLSQMANSQDDRYLRDTAKKMLAARPTSRPRSP